MISHQQSYPSLQDEEECKKKKNQKKKKKKKIKNEKQKNKKLMTLPSRLSSIASSKGSSFGVSNSILPNVGKRVIQI